eukprot:3080192-Pyramimonas_sp.AAC.1
MGRRWRSGWTTDSAGGGGQCDGGPSRALPIDACEADAYAGSQVFEAAVELKGVRGRLYVPPFHIVHLEALWRLCRAPTPGSHIGHLQPNDCPLVGFPRALYQLPNNIPNFWRWQGLLWAFTDAFMRGAAFVINRSTAPDAAKHCDDIAAGIQDAWSQRQAAEAFAALRRVSA